jgi:hypothetical protein
MALALAGLAIASAMGQGVRRNFRLVDGAKHAKASIGLDRSQCGLDVAEPLAAAI